MVQHEQREHAVVDMAEDFIKGCSKKEIDCILNHPEIPYDEGTLFRIMGIFKCGRRCARELMISAQMVACLRSEMQEVR